MLLKWLSNQVFSSVTSTVTHLSPIQMLRFSADRNNAFTSFHVAESRLNSPGSSWANVTYVDMSYALCPEPSRVTLGASNNRKSNAVTFPNKYILRPFKKNFRYPVSVVFSRTYCRRFDIWIHDSWGFYKTMFHFYFLYISTKFALRCP